MEILFTSELQLHKFSSKHKTGEDLSARIEADGLFNSVGSYLAKKPLILQEKASKQ